MYDFEDLTVYEMKERIDYLWGDICDNIEENRDLQNQIDELEDRLRELGEDV